MPDENGLVGIAVSYDMAWQRRNGGHSSNTGHGAVMGITTGKVLDYGTRTEAGDNLFLCHFAHSLNKTENLGQNFLRPVKLPRTEKTTRSSHNTFQIFKVYIKELEKSQVMSSKRLDFRG